MKKLVAHSIVVKYKFRYFYLQNLFIELISNLRHGQILRLLKDRRCNDFEKVTCRFDASLSNP